jgi:hypothetical protein
MPTKPSPAQGLATGFEVVLSGLLSRDTTFALHVSGQYGPREIDNLIRILSLQAEFHKPDEK